jgi:hypothetical protein
MGGILQVDTIQNNNATTLITQTNTTTLTFGVSGQNIVIPSGVTFNTANATVNLPSTINATTINVTTVVLAAGAVGTPSLTTSGDTNTGIFFPAADTIAFTEGGTEALRINSDSQTVYPLGTAALPSMTFTGDVNTGIFSPTADTIAFTGGGVEAMRIDSSGNIFAPFNSTSKRLVVGGDGSTTYLGAAVCIKNPISAGASLNYAIHINDPNTNTAGGQNLIAFSHNGEDYSSTNVRAAFGCTIDGGGNGTLVFNTGSYNSQTTNMKLNSSGSLILTGSTAQKASGTTWSNPSDTRLKDNKKNYTKGLTELLQINVKTWEWNGKAGTTEGTTGIGVIADEIEVLLPNTVDTYKAKLNIDDTEETDVKRFDATEITWLLLNSIKELSAKNDALEARLTVLENN